MAETAPPSNQDIQNLVDSTLSSFEQFRIKRRNLRFPNEPIIGGGGFGRVHRAYLVTRVLGGPSVAVAVKKLYPRDKPFLSISAVSFHPNIFWANLDDSI
ncbi:hypothetical protein FRB99_005454 [Tulasnella sp. 403]|nr:hypothetical protein FRB99_005454 [Tulasnella sp. 403]